MLPLSKGVVVLLTVSFIGLGVIIISDLLIPPSPEEQLRLLRSELARLRTAADSCQTALGREEAQLLATDERLDWLKSRIEYYEALDPRGVPADSYDIYMGAFNAYNDGIPERGLAADTLQAHWRSCRAIAEQHNRTADSARTLATEMGLMPDSASAQTDPATPAR